MPFPSRLTCCSTSPSLMQEGCGPLLSLLSELTATSPFGRPPLTQVLHACELHMRSLEPQVVLGRAVRRAAGHSSTVRACTQRRHWAQTHSVTPHPSPSPHTPHPSHLTPPLAPPPLPLIPHMQESLVSISSSQLSLAGCVSKSSLAVVGSKGEQLVHLSQGIHSYMHRLVVVSLSPLVAQAS